MVDRDDDLTIIGIGSSAGGLEAIRELVATLPADLKVTYVIVQHMSPHHKSLMTELVSRQTELKVQDATDGVVPQPNVIYITPPKTDIIYDSGKLRLIEPSPEVASPRPSVDRFLLSLADKHGEKSMAIILSGTGTDGAYGVQAIREAGGITIAQDAGSAKYDGMPTAAVQTGCVDLILRPHDIGKHLQKILTAPRDFEDLKKASHDKNPLSDLLQILLARTRVDFHDYKQSTVKRRIDRRMMALGIESREEYTQFCRDNPQAVDALFKDLLISVTRFFRDKGEFDRLAAMIPALLEKHSDRPLRVWIAGCATGEEAYSVAILLSEALGGPKVQLKDYVQIFATDIDKDALAVARRGVYGIAALNNIPKAFAEQYFIRQNDGIRVIDSLRSAILFSDHNVCQDPPFQKIDLLCCRNLLIYFNNGLQYRVMSRFHYALNPSSLLFLGTAESIAGSDELFIQDKNSQHIYRKRSIQRQENVPFSRAREGSNKRLSKPNAQPAAGQSTERQMFEALLLGLGKNSILVTDEYSIVRVQGNVSPFIEMNAQSNLKMHIDLLRRPYREEARSLVALALKSGEHRSGIRHEMNADNRTDLRLDVYPIIARDINERAALVVFNELPAERQRSKRGSADEDRHSPENDRIRVLEDEVATTREVLQQTIEELETSNEELQSLNEELQSTNEELQATNEELETSNEELQSTNEELITVNEELQVTAAELSGRTGELMSVLETAPLAIMVLDPALQIVQATNAAAELFGLARPIANPHVSQCSLPENFPSLAPICSETLKLGEAVDKEFKSRGAQVKLTCSPFFDMRGQMKGVTLVVSEFPGMALEMDMLLDHAQIHMISRSPDSKIVRISECAAAALGTTRKEAEGDSYRDLVNEAAARDAWDEDHKLIDGTDGIRHSTRTVESRFGDRRSWMREFRFLMPETEARSTSVYTIAFDVTDLIEGAERREAGE
ncbi:chemotaxis protein CheB [Sulfitobacter sp. LCG007]